MTRHLLHVGYPKAGSTFLQRWFTAHPQLAYRLGALAGFHDVYDLTRACATADDGSLYRVTSEELLSAPHLHGGPYAMDYRLTEDADIAAAQLRVCAMLAALFPNALVLIVTRGFKSMILSSYSQFVRAGGAVDLVDLVDSAVTRRGREFEYLASRAPWDYDHLVGAYRNAFGAENVIVLPYELLRDDPDEFTRCIALRLDIDHVAVPRQRINESLSPAAMYWYPRLTRLMRRIPSRKLFDVYVRAAFHDRLGMVVRLLQRLRPGTPVTAAAIPDEVVAAFRGRAESLRTNPLYAPYASDYLHEPVVAG